MIQQHAVDSVTLRKLWKRKLELIKLSLQSVFLILVYLCQDGSSLFLLQLDWTLNTMTGKSMKRKVSMENQSIKLRSTCTYRAE